MAKNTKTITVSVEDKLKALYELQKIDSSIDKIRIVRGELPLEIEDLNATFLKRAEGDTYFTCNHVKDIDSAVRKVISSKERVNLNVPVTATVPDKFGEEPVAEFTITLSMKEY